VLWLRRFGGLANLEDFPQDVVDGIKLGVLAAKLGYDELLLNGKMLTLDFVGKVEVEGGAARGPPPGWIPALVRGMLELRQSQGAIGGGGELGCVQALLGVKGVEGGGRAGCGGRGLLEEAVTFEN
jgi:hypothetical protein